MPTGIASPILAVDVQYVTTSDSTTGYAAAVLFEDFSSSTPSAVFSVAYPGVAPYEPGSFFKRELPPILAAIAASPVPPAVIVVDGFVDLAPGRPGLGCYLYKELGETVPVIGVAKSPFRPGIGTEVSPEASEHGGTSDEEVSAFAAMTSKPSPRAILRGASSRALYITSAGMDQTLAATLVTGMHGKNRIPTLLKLADSEARGAAKEGSTTSIL